MTTNVKSPEELNFLEGLGKFVEQLVTLVEKYPKQFLLVIDAKPNIWDIIYPSSAKEVRYSRVLAWLLDPQGDHELGASFANALLDEVAKGSDSVAQAVKQWKESDASKATVSAKSWVAVEQHNIDILLIDSESNRYIAIENKTGTGVHAHADTGISQLTWYGWTLDQDFGKQRLSIRCNKDLSDSRKKRLMAELADRQLWMENKLPSSPESELTGFKFYLTPEGRDPEDVSTLITPECDDPDDNKENRDWGRISYIEHIDRALEECLKSGAVNDAVERIITDFREAFLRRFSPVPQADIDSLYFVGGADKKLKDRTKSHVNEIVFLARELSLISDSSSDDGDDSTGAEEQSQNDFYVNLAFDSKELPTSAAGDILDVLQGLQTDGKALLSLPEFKNAPTKAKLKRLIGYLWSRRPKDGQQIHEVNVDVQNMTIDLMGIWCGESEHTAVDHFPGRSCKMKNDLVEDLAKPGTNIEFFCRRSGDKGMGVYLYTDTEETGLFDKRKTLSFYVRGDRHGTFPAEFKAVGGSDKQKARKPKKPLGSKDMDAMQMSDALLAEIKNIVNSEGGPVF